MHLLCKNNNLPHGSWRTGLDSIEIIGFIDADRFAGLGGYGEAEQGIKKRVIV